MVVEVQDNSFREGKNVIMCFCFCHNILWKSMDIK
jgi:hypothetical protein